MFRIDADLEVPELPCLSLQVPFRAGAIGSHVDELASRVADDKIGDPLDRKSLVTMVMACKICADVVLVVQGFPWPKVRITCGPAIMPDRMMMYRKCSCHGIVQLFLEPGYLALGQGQGRVLIVTDIVWIRGVKNDEPNI